MATEPLQCKALLLRVSIHCEGCKKKVKRVLQSVDGVYRCDIDARSNKVMVAVTGNVGADALVKRLRKSGKHAEQWPDQQQLADSTHTPREARNSATQPDKAGDTGAAEKPASGDAEAETSAAEQSNSKPSPEDPNKTAAVSAQPAQDGTESTNADGDDAVTKEATAEQCKEPQTKRKQQQQQQQPEEEKPVDAMVVVTAASGQGIHAGHLPPPLQQQLEPPVHVLSYSVARPSASAAYYAAAPAAPLQELPYTYPPCCYYPHPSPYHGSFAPQTGVASPARDSYSDLFSDDNANSCSVM